MWYTEFITGTKNVNNYTVLQPLELMKLIDVSCNKIKDIQLYK